MGTKVGEGRKAITASQRDSRCFPCGPPAASGIGSWRVEEACLAGGKLLDAGKRVMAEVIKESQCTSNVSDKVLLVQTKSPGCQAPTCVYLRSRVYRGGR